MENVRIRQTVKFDPAFSENEQTYAYNDLNVVIVNVNDKDSHRLAQKKLDNIFHYNPESKISLTPRMARNTHIPNTVPFSGISESAAAKSWRPALKYNCS